MAETVEFDDSCSDRPRGKSSAAGLEERTWRSKVLGLRSVGANRARRGWRRRAFACLVAFAFLTMTLPDTLAATTSSIQDEAPETIQDEAQAPTIQDGEEALAQDLALSAEARGWTVEEAKAHWLSGEVVGPLGGTIAARWPEIYTGSVLSDQPYGAPAIYIKGPAPEELVSLVSDAEIPVLVVDNQPYSFDELEERKLTVHRALVALGFDYAVTGFDVTARGTINTSVTRKPGIPGTEDSIKAALPSHIRDSVNVTVRDTPVLKEEQLAYGGMLVTDDGGDDPGEERCTSGWSVYKSSLETTGVTTAGHCDGINWIHEPDVGQWELTHKQQHRGSYGDVEWKTSPKSEPALFFASEGEVRMTKTLEPYDRINQGDKICVYGRATNIRKCAFVKEESVAVIGSGGVLIERLVQMDADVTVDGDSGGGWSFANRAEGSHYGDCGDFSCFSVADLYDEALGVRVRLARLLPTGITLFAEEWLYSNDERFEARMQGDGNFVIYQNGTAIWSTKTAGNSGARIRMQADGNLVLYNSNYTKALWGTKTSGSNHYLIMQDDGNLVMYRGSTPVWSSGTGGR